MRVGFVLECCKDGADHKVLEHVVGKLHSDLKLCFRFCKSKRELFDDCGKFVEGLFTVERCDRVFVVWDLMPCDEAYKDDGKPSCVKERAFLLKALRREDRARTVLLCITHELEAWLLADGKALTSVLDNDNHPIKPIQDDRTPERHPNPKKVLNKLFKEHRRREYDDKVHALKIIKQVNLSKLERAPSFARLKDKLARLDAS